MQQSFLHLKITKLGSELSQVPVQVNLGQVMEELDQLGYSHDTFLHLAGEVNTSKEVQEAIVFNNQNNANVLSSLDNRIHVLITVVSDHTPDDYLSPTEDCYDKQYGKQNLKGYHTVKVQKSSNQLNQLCSSTWKQRRK